MAGLPYTKEEVVYRLKKTNRVESAGDNRESRIAFRCYSG